MINGGITNAVLRLIRFVNQRVVHDRAKRDPGNQQQIGQQSGRLPVPVRTLHIGESRHLVHYGRAEVTTGRHAVGLRTAWDGSRTRFVLWQGISLGVRSELEEKLTA